MDFEKEIYIKLGQNIKKYRLAKNFSQEKLSELLDANPKFIGHVERVERYISLKKLIQISQILDIPLYSFFDFRNTIYKYINIIIVCQVLRNIFIGI